MNCAPPPPCAHLSQWWNTHEACPGCPITGADPSPLLARRSSDPRERRQEGHHGGDSTHLGLPVPGCQPHYTQQSLCGPPCLTRPAGSVITSPEDREQKKPSAFSNAGTVRLSAALSCSAHRDRCILHISSVLAHRLRIIVELLVLVAPAGKCRGRRRAVENARESAGRGACFPTLMRSGGEPASTPTPTHHSRVCVHGEDTHEKSVPSRQSRRFSGWVRDDF